MRYILTIFLSAAAIAAFAQQGIIKESLTVKSPILGTNVEYSVYLPSDYNISNRHYPVLYLLHGYTDDEIGWTQFGEVDRIADRVINSGEAPPMIIVMPDAGVSWYINSADGKVMWEDFFIKEFIPHIDAGLRTRPTREFRAIAGLSMGGHGTLIMAMKHPDLFTAAAPLSAGIFTEKELIDMPDETWKNVFGPPYGEHAGEARLTDHLKQNWILGIVESANADDLKKVKYYIDCGDGDFLIKGNMELHALLIDKGVPHEFRVRDGIHNWDYWRTALPEVLKFVGSSFHR
ncbi:MAG TPA: alpha/beta hydrolase-fold protein [Flavilitoribacter sp.]|nr:alpha/beta hydrolase-fold protein [Flavilitoribacter sp.]HMQ86245.1 alpha/beta hydrolase-fold protein [Flavilitoribacter sp.]